jgi:pimeloyl-ACP methyl ester carboxylesterase
MPELVLLPGVDGTGTLFGPFLAALGDVIPVRIIPYPANGTTSYPEITAWVRDRLPAGDFVLLGESFAGPVAASLAAERPDGLRGLILCSTFLRNPRPMARHLSPLLGLLRVSRGLARLASPALLGRRPAADIRAKFIEAVGGMTAQTLRGRLRSVLSAGGASPSRIDVPVLCLRATRDVLVPGSSAKWIRHVLPEARIVDVDGPHGLLQASPLACARHVSEFIESLPAVG